MKLFVGFPVNPQFLLFLNALDPSVSALFIQTTGDEYLRAIEYDNKPYLGKFSADPTPIRDLKLLETNIYSLLKRLVPNYACEHIPLEVFPLTEEESQCQKKN